MDRTKLGSLLVAASAVSFGTMAIFAKIAYSQGVTVFTLLAGRFTIASLVVWAVIIILKKPVILSLVDLKKIALLGLFGYGGASTCFFISLNLLPASLASMLLYTHPVMVALAEQCIYRRKLTRAKVAALFLSLLGIVMILGTTIEGVNIAGVFTGFASAVFYSIYLLYGNKVVRERSPVVTTGYMLTFAAAGFTLYAFSAGSLGFNFNPAGWWSIAAIAVFSTALPILTLFFGLQWIEASRAAIISTLEPAFTVVCAAIIFSETIRPLQMLGGAAVLAAIIVLQSGRLQKEETRGLGGQSGNVIE